MRHDEESTTLTSIVGTSAVSGLAVAAIVFAFAANPPVIAVLVVSGFVGASLAILASITFTRPLQMQLHLERAGRAAVDDELAIARVRRGFIEQLDTAIDIVDTEDEAIKIIGKALSMLVPERDNAVLLAPAEQSRITWFIPADEEGLSEAQPVGEAMLCAALTLGRTVTAASSTELDACPHLIHHGWEVSSVCVPIRVGEQHLGVAHSAGPAGDLPDEEARRLLELVTRRVGNRIQLLRAARKPSDQASLDPLTRLPSHTVVQRRLRDAIGDHTPFSIAFCDIDAFRGYNECFGIEAGDRALQIFADVMSATVRPGDVVARFSGDRFLVMFPNCSAHNACAAMERVRESLVLELALQEIDPFTASTGIVDSGDAEAVEELLELADVALAVAKNSGGNRVVVNDFEEIHLPDVR